MKKAKLIIFILIAIFTLFFSNDFGLIDVEKTSIITAVAIDKDQDGYIVTAQIAVPEATDQNSENRKAEISGKGKTVGEALKNTGDISGWFPKLAFCNLIILGNGLTEDNVVKVLDYFAKTLRVQDSALVALAEKEGKELLSLSTPLDNISSFALQKILLKNPGFDRDVYSMDIKTFCSGHYSPSKSAFMPMIKVIKSDASDSGQSSSSGQSSGSGSSSQSGSGGSGSSGQSSDGGQKNKNLFDARTTALFLDGIKVGELDPELTFMFNAFTMPLTDNNVSVDKVPYKNGECNYLLTVLKSNPKIEVSANDKTLDVTLKLSLYCKVSDVNADDNEEALSQNNPLPQPLTKRAKEMLTERTNELVQTSVQTGCDFLKIKEKLYRFNNKQYSKYKDNYLSVMNVKVNIDVYGQS